MHRLIGIVVMLWFLHASAATAAPGVLDAPLSLQAGSAATLRVEVPARVKVCSFNAKSGNHRVAASRYRVGDRLIIFSWRIPRNAKATTWTLRATCASAESRLRKTRPYSTSLRVRLLRGVRSRRSVLVARGTLRVRSAALRKGIAGLVGPSGDVGGKGAGSGCDGYGVDAGGYCLGFCTHYAWTKRTDLTRLGHARDWRGGAQSRGIPTGATPTPGAIAWWGSSFGGGYGHVAYVERVGGNNVVISEMNAVGWNRVSSRSIPLGSPGAPQGYIYGGIAGGQPGGSSPGEPVPVPTGPADLGQGMMAGTSPSIAASPGGGYQVAFQANTGNLYRYASASGAANLDQGMKSGTSPSIAALPGGGYQMAFQANTGDLVVVGSAGDVNTHQGMMAGTSPSIAASPGGGYQVAFQANTGNLYRYASASGAANLNQGMKSGTSPSIAALPGGGYQMAFQANTGDLVVVGSAGDVNTHQGMMAGTSPSIAASPGGGYQVAFQANTGNLYRYASASGAANLNQGMKSGTSPSIAALPGGGYQMAFQANTGDLVVVGSAGDVNTHQGMMAGTSPSIAASPGGGYQVAFQANTGNLYRYAG